MGGCIRRMFGYVVVCKGNIVDLRLYILLASSLLRSGLFHDADL